MNEEEKGISRRRFIRVAALASAATALGGAALSGEDGDQQRPSPAPEAGPAKALPRSKVVLVRDRSAVKAGGALDGAVLGRMLDEAACALADEPRPTEAWRRFFGPQDVVGIKTNVWKFLATPPEVEAALKARIASCGVPEGALRITDRQARTLLAPCTALLNTRPVRTHHWAGVGGCIKNYIMFVEEPSAYHPDSCAGLGAIWNLPIVKGKTRLNVLVALTPHFYGRGPHNFDPRYVWTYGGLFVSRDPVAVDALGAELLRRKRVDFFGEDRPVTSWKHVELAETRHGIGVADLNRIDLVRIGWEERNLL